jgi:putative glutamine amidotransferase
MMRERRQPTIGVTGPDRGGAAAWIFTRFAVYRAGGCAVRITPHHPCEIDKLDGLIIGGGADVDPKLYGQELLHVGEKKSTSQPLSRWALNLILFALMWLVRKIASAHMPTHGGRDAQRDALEMRLIHGAIARGLPILGICRGAQLLNVYFGGSIYQSLKGFYVEDPEVRTILPRKRIDVPPDAKLRAIIGAHPPRVNALHRQAIHQLGEGVRVAARDRNGIIQAIEHESLPMVVGVQWHPEYLPQVPQQAALFHALVRYARRRAPTKPSSYPALLPHVLSG